VGFKGNAYGGDYDDNYEDGRHQFDKDDEDSGDEDIDVDILADVRQAEEFATNQS
jgi:hypothetical protein